MHAHAPIVQAHTVVLHCAVQMLNYSGCGNTVNVNHPVVKQMVIDSLVKWVTEFHVDGFRFDLSSAMCRGVLCVHACVCVRACVCASALMLAAT